MGTGCVRLAAAGQPRRCSVRAGFRWVHAATLADLSAFEWRRQRPTPPVSQRRNPGEAPTADPMTREFFEGSPNGRIGIVVHPASHLIHNHSGATRRATPRSASR